MSEIDSGAVFKYVVAPITVSTVLAVGSAAATHWHTAVAYAGSTDAAVIWTAGLSAVFLIAAVGAVVFVHDYFARKTWLFAADSWLWSLPLVGLAVIAVMLLIDLYTGT